MHVWKFEDENKLLKGVVITHTKLDAKEKIREYLISMLGETYNDTIDIDKISIIDYTGEYQTLDNGIILF